MSVGRPPRSHDIGRQNVLILRILGVFPRWTPIWAFPTMYVREKLIRRVNYLEYDDELLRLYPEEYIALDEVKQALEERGVYLPPISVRQFMELTRILRVDHCLTLCLNRRN